SHHEFYGEPRHREAPYPVWVPPKRRIGRFLTAAAIVFLASWAGTATLYPLFRDDALRYLAERQVEITRANEQRVFDLETEIDRLRSLKLIEQERVERTVDNLVRRQTVLEARQSALTGLATTKTGGSDITGSLPSPAAPANAKPTPLSDTTLLN